MTILGYAMTPADWIAVSGLPMLAYGVWLAWQTRHIDPAKDADVSHPAE
ncbi:MAG TPA: hypothetical protein VG387_13730 [Rhizomicrobium sp.]|jgi:hypothetical protein|nr:hypothetical protein [Rhizomicrobium sp.]